MSARRKIGVPTPESLDDVWQRRASAAAIVAVRDVIAGGTIPPATPVSKLSDIEIGWMFAASLFAWIRTRAEQATAEGWDLEATLHETSFNPSPWDEGAIGSILPLLGAMPDVDWDKPLSTWSKNQMVNFLIKATYLIHNAMVARDVAGGITSPSRKSLDEMQRLACSAAGGSLVTPGELNDLFEF